MSSISGTMGREDPPGTYEDGAGALYRVAGSTCIRLAQGIGISNGLAWDLREKALYYVDSLERNLRRYDYDVETGEVCEYLCMHAIFMAFCLNAHFDEANGGCQRP